MRVLVCGGRDYNHADAWNLLERDLKDYIADKLDLREVKIDTLIQGGARGADEAAAAWGKSEDAKVLEFKADWKQHGKAAGPIRNRRMIEVGKPDVVAALPGGRGTRNMIQTAYNANVPVVLLGKHQEAT